MDTSTKRAFAERNHVKWVTTGAFPPELIVVADTCIVGPLPFPLITVLVVVLVAMVLARGFTGSSWASLPELRRKRTNKNE